VFVSHLDLFGLHSSLCLIVFDLIVCDLSIVYSVFSMFYPLCVVYLSVVYLSVVYLCAVYLSVVYLCVVHLCVINLCFP
jgi:hypothetical protein